MNRFQLRPPVDDLPASVATFSHRLRTRSGIAGFVAGMRRLSQACTRWFAEMGCLPDAGCTTRRLLCCWG